MDKLLFNELQKSLGQMEDHASGTEVEAVREIVLEAKASDPWSKDMGEMPQKGKQ